MVGVLLFQQGKWVFQIHHRSWKYIFPGF
ncbi:hypothetical protein Golob_017678 [Gossypium lobatum]|uniref:Uncharacterized protein n=1 Tax=Gossypium lobatum TaxID=34289 RepID=A0A7J8M7W7_9ROSI|nr:hypothetical protein [Gossypium lobatum]